MSYWNCQDDEDAGGTYADDMYDDLDDAPQWVRRVVSLKAESDRAQREWRRDCARHSMPGLIADEKALEQEHAPVQLMTGFDRMVDEMTAYLGFWDDVRKEN